MRNILLTTVTAVTLCAAVPVPASAQVYLGADPGGAGVQVGPFGFVVGPRYDRAYRDYDYGYGCPLVRERIVTPSGHIIYRTHRSCY